MIHADVPEDPVCDSYDFFVPMSLIQRLACGGDRGSALRIKWTEWGPDNSRCILTKDVELDYFVHGNRYVSREDDFLSVFDFNPKKRLLGEFDPSKKRRYYRFDCRSMPSTVSGYPTQYIRLERITTCLPYSTSEGVYEGALGGLSYEQSAMIDDEHILLVDVNSELLMCLVRC
jgi:hypothetical protein